MFFPIKRLPLELALEIIRLSATPEIQLNNTQSPVPRYQNAKVLCLVSHGFREVTMPHLLHTVVFVDTESVYRFMRSLEAQTELHARRARLALDYRPLVQHIWCTRYLLGVSGSPEFLQLTPGTRSIMHDIVNNACTVGFNFNAMCLLSETISGVRDQADPKNQKTSVQADGWRCKRLTLAGMGIRWNPITSSRQGLAFLAVLTHLTLWSPNIHQSGPPGAVPYWLARVPLEHMPNLAHLAFSLNHTEGSTKMDVLMYTCLIPNHSYTPSKQGHIFRLWAASANPLEHGTVVQVHIENVDSVTPIPDHCFELAFLRAAAAAQVRY